MSSRAGQKQAARVVRDQLARERRRQRTRWTSVVAVVVLLLAGLAGWAVYANQSGGTVTTPSGTVADGTGFAVGTGPVTIDVYEDFLCPNCASFEQQGGGRTVAELARQGRATVVYHPIAILDGASTTDYSTRAAAGAACAGAAGRFTEFGQALYAQQPPEGGPGLDDDKLIEIGRSVGLTDDTFARCVRDGTYRPWVAQVTDAAAGRGVTGTPTVLVAGRPVPRPDAAAITAAVTAAGA